MNQSDDLDTEEENFELDIKKPKVTYKKKLSKTHLALDEFKPWLATEKDGTAKCTVCNASLKGGKSELKRHSLTKTHVENMNAKSCQPKVSAFLPQTDKVKQSENAMCSFLVQHDLSLSFVEPLLDFCKHLPEKSILDKMTLGKQKASNVVRQGLRPYFIAELQQKLSSNTYFSVFIDECTDITSKSQLGIVVSYYSVDSKTTEIDVIYVIEVSSGTAEGIYKTLIDTLKLYKINLDNWVGFCSDTTAVMMGANHSVAQLIVKNFSYVRIVKCSCHSIDLIASYACKRLSNSLEDMCRTIYNHFKRNPKRQREFETFQKF